MPIWLKSISTGYRVASYLAIMDLHSFGFENLIRMFICIIASIENRLQNVNEIFVSMMRT